MKVFASNTADPTAFAHIALQIRDRLGLCGTVMVGDRRLITSTRIEQLRELGGLGWVTAQRAPDIALLAATESQGRQIVAATAQGRQLAAGRPRSAERRWYSHRHTRSAPGRRRLGRL